MIGGMEMVGSVEVTRMMAPERVMQLVCDLSGLTRAQLAGPARTRIVSEWRHIAILLMRQFTPASFADIGHMLGGRNHSTVVYGCRRGRELSSTTPWDAVVLAARKALAGKEGER